MAKTKILLSIVIVFFFFLLSYRLLEVPTGFTVDESAFGYNAALLARTGLDENGIKLPIFVSSINHSDWRQPWTQYYIALFFKIFGISLFNLRLSSVILTLLSALLLFYLIKLLLGKKLAFFSLLLYLTTPVIFMHSHFGLDNIMTVPFTLLWLIFLYRYTTNFNKRFLLYSGLALGASFYTYKGMRAVVPVWSFISLIYIFKLKAKDTIYFLVGLLPFIFVLPILHHYYPGAIFGGARPKFNGFYNFFYSYLSHYDLNFLFIKGDALLFHSTQIHGMYLLASAPLFFIGIYRAVKKSSFWLFLLIAFFSAPALYGLVDSTYRASRIICLVPVYISLATLGLDFLIRQKNKIIPIVLGCLILVNFIDFVKYYWFTYPKFTENIFGHMTRDISYRIFSEETFARRLSPYVDRDIFEGFFAAVHFKSPPQIVDNQILPPLGSIYLSSRDNLTGLTKLNLKLPHFTLYTNP
jgi:hypothetical protein